MKLIIVEDEIAASDNLIYLLQSINPKIEIVTVVDSVKSAVSYLSKPYEADLIMMDIHLADGISFEIFDQVKVSTPIIFTTAYDQYAIQAFKVNSIDYLLKPIDEDELKDALEKFEKQLSTNSTEGQNSQLEGLLSLIKTQNKQYKSTYLVHHRDELLPIKVDDIAFFYIDTGVVKVKTVTNQTYSVDKKLEDIESELDPAIFIRANRQSIVQKSAVENIKYYFNSKLIVNTNPPSPERIIVSKAKATAFKKWMDS